jgi:hypothetical protein
MMFGSCKKSVVEQRAEDIRKHNAMLDRESRIGAVQEVRKYWTANGGAWFGKLADGSLVRLETPVVTVDPVKAGNSFCSSWLGEVTITANRWHSIPAAANSKPFVMKYRAVLENAGHYRLIVTMGLEAARPSVQEMELLNALPN